MTKRLIAVEEELLPRIRELAKDDTIEPTVLEVSPTSVVVFNVKQMAQALGKVRAATAIRQFSGAMRESLKKDIGLDVPVICITEDREVRILDPEFMLGFGWVQIPEGVEDPEARQKFAKFVIDRLNGGAKHAPKGDR